MKESSATRGFDRVVRWRVIKRIPLCNSSQDIQILVLLLEWKGFSVNKARRNLMHLNNQKASNRLMVVVFQPAHLAQFYQNSNVAKICIFKVNFLCQKKIWMLTFFSLKVVKLGTNSLLLTFLMTSGLKMLECPI